MYIFFVGVVVFKGNLFVVMLGEFEFVIIVIYFMIEYVIIRCVVNVMNCLGFMESKIVVMKILDVYIIVCFFGVKVIVFF